MKFNFSLISENDLDINNNYESRKFEITNNEGGLYSLDGIDVYENPSISRTELVLLLIHQMV